MALPAQSLSSSPADAAALPRRFAETASVVEAALRRELDGWLADVPKGLGEATRYALLGPGKRLRPVLLLWCAELTGGAGRGRESAAAAMPGAVAIEMLHTYSLVHDDLPAMDDDDLRRGRPTCHKAFGEGVAVLVGDALLTRAFEVIARADLAADRRAAMAAELARGGGAAGMIGGQAEDLAFQNRAGDLATVEYIHEHKTAALFASACRMGAIAAGGSDAAADLWGRFGRSLGLAFQIADDLLDETGATEHVGKQTGKDRSAGKLTHPSVVGVGASRAAAAQWIARAESALDRLAETLKPGGEGAGLLDDLRALSRYVIERTR
ncbi:MAG: Farnesyl diphosphate synthase [Phycisphaerae bacterium]|nr:Farnesyl diphosphate synthase [Phycisphaerae bacterium]